MTDCTITNPKWRRPVASLPRRLFVELRYLWWRAAFAIRAASASVAVAILLMAFSQRDPSIVDYRLLEFHFVCVLVAVTWGLFVPRGLRESFSAFVPVRTTTVLATRIISGAIVLVVAWSATVTAVLIARFIAGSRMSSVPLMAVLPAMFFSILSAYAVACVAALLTRRPLRWILAAFAAVVVGLPLLIRLSTGAFHVESISPFLPYAFEVTLLRGMLGQSLQPAALLSDPSATTIPTALWAASVWIVLLTASRFAAARPRPSTRQRQSQ